MPTVPHEIISRLGGLMNQVWQTVSLTVSEAANQSINFTTPLTLATRTSDLYAEIASPLLVIQFSFANQPEHSQVLLISQETAYGLFELVKGETVDEIDENTISDLRGPLEAMVQGICLAIGNVKNEAIVASGLSIRYQIFSFPQNLQRADELVRTQVAVSGDDLSGTLIWLSDSETAHEILGVNMVEPDDAMPFPQAHGGASGGRPVHPLEDHGSLELLMDIPLEISVELGRVKMLVKDVVDLGTGSIVEIDKAAGEPVDVLVNGRLVARGEVVVIEDNFGVRITEILNPHERMGRLGDAA